MTFIERHWIDDWSEWKLMQRIWAQKFTAIPFMIQIEKWNRWWIHRDLPGDWWIRKFANSNMIPDAMDKHNHKQMDWETVITEIDHWIQIWWNYRDTTSWKMTIIPFWEWILKMNANPNVKYNRAEEKTIIWTKLLFSINRWTAARTTTISCLCIGRVKWNWHLTVWMDPEWMEICVIEYEIIKSVG